MGGTLTWISPPSSGRSIWKGPMARSHSSWEPSWARAAAMASSLGMWEQEELGEKEKFPFMLRVGSLPWIVLRLSKAFLLVQEQSCAACSLLFLAAGRGLPRGQCGTLWTGRCSPVPPSFRGIDCKDCISELVRNAYSHFSTWTYGLEILGVEPPLTPHPKRSLL